jgi:Cof subfamily protein (haloacid dehalogenase superfamily)
MIRLLVSDVDGTLITKDKQLTPAVHAASARLTENGIKLVLVSSRPTHGVAIFADALALDTPRAGLNGGVFTDARGGVLQARFLAPEAARTAVSYLQDNGISPWLFTDTEWLLTNPDGDYVEREHRSIKMPFRVVADFEAAIDRAGKIMAASTDYPKLKACEAALQEILRGSAAVHRSQDSYLDITHPDANKGEAVRQAARLLDIDLASVACIGDMVNDLPMFDVAPFRIAMGNAPDFMRARADYVTGTNEESGWAQAVDRYIIPTLGPN